jgi:vacuolar-type H+-ATPase subunit H
LGELALDNILKQVIESEYRAQKILQEAEEERKHISENLEKDLQQLQQQIFNDTNLKILQMKDEKKNNALIQAKKINSENEAKVSSMKNKFENSRELWVKNLFEKIIGR